VFHLVLWGRKGRGRRKNQKGQPRWVILQRRFLEQRKNRPPRRKTPLGREFENACLQLTRERGKKREMSGDWRTSEGGNMPMGEDFGL